MSVNCGFCGRRWHEDANDDAHCFGLQLAAEVEKRKAAEERCDAARLHAEALERMIADLVDETPYDYDALEEALPTIDSAESSAIWLAAQAHRYAKADEVGKADIRAFHLSAGVPKLRRRLRGEGA